MTRRIKTERTAAQLLTDFGAPPARKTRTPNGPSTPSERINRPVAPRRGRARRGEGWAPVEAPLTVYQAATHEIGGLFPLLAANGIPAVGARIGYDTLSGGAFYAHPIEWVLRGMCTNPNMVIFGEPGRGKSSTVVAFLLRMMLVGVRTLISGDVKGEYTPLLHALGIQPIGLGRGSRARLNALDLGPLSQHWNTWSVARQRDELDGVLGRWVKLLTALAEAQGYTPTVTDEAVLSQVLRRLVGAADGYTHLCPVTIPDVQRELAAADTTLWETTRFADRRQFLDQLRPITDVLANLIHGPLAGLFDEPTNFELDWAAPIQSMDLSRLRSRGDQAVAVALTCLGSWSSMITDLQDDGEIRIVVRDEVWRQMRLGPKAVQAVDSDLRLSRAEKKIQILVGHKPSDFLSVGNAGSQEVAIAKDLLALCSTRILFGQSTRVADELAEDFALSGKESDVTTGWCMERTGRALWKLENKPGYKVQSVLSRVEKQTFDTNAQLRENPASFGAGGGTDEGPATPGRWS
ncbi:ATP-binding protein [Saccharopolyspora sp. ID03-671]|uniref:ATP-binding protein n=1 Tax=Saccharopolyspora sp. ID03-671 TaxID=3073066 RepID=UPI003254D954